MKHPLLTFLLLLLSLGSQASLALSQSTRETYPLGNLSLTLEAPDGWMAEPDLFNVPLAVLGPSKERSVLLIAPLDIKIAPENLNHFAGGDAEYREGREEWLKEVEGESIEYFASTQIPSPPHLRIQMRGYRYQLDDQRFIEKLYFVSCDGHLLTLTALIPQTREGSDLSTLDQIIGSLRCN